MSSENDYLLEQSDLLQNKLRSARSLRKFLKQHQIIVAERRGFKVKHIDLGLKKS